MTTTAAFEDLDEFKTAMATVRKDGTDDKYLIVGHVEADPSKLCLRKVGQNVSELSSEMDDTQVLYILSRYERAFDMSSTIKFVYIHWIGDQVPFSKKGRYGVVQGSVQEYFNPYHLLIETSHTEDLEYSVIEKQLDETSGTTSKVLDNDIALGRQKRGFVATQLPQRDRQKAGGVFISKETASIEVSNDVLENIAAVRHDGEAQRWMLTCYRDNNPKGPLDCLACGDGDITELLPHLADDLVLYGLYRVTDKVDDIVTVKFVYIQWVGDKVKPMTKAKISTNKGRLEEIFTPYHVLIFTSDRSDLTETTIHEKVSSASGTKSFVK